MIAILRSNEVLIEDGYTRATVYQDGSGYLHIGHEVHDVDMHTPEYLRAARSAGLAILDGTLRTSEDMLREMYG